MFAEPSHKTKFNFANRTVASTGGRLMSALGQKQASGLLEGIDGVIRGKLKLSRDQMRMLIEYFPYATPKLNAIASTTLDSQSFAALLDSSIERSRGAKLIEAKPVPVTEQQDASQLKGPMAKLRRF